MIWLVIGLSTALFLAVVGFVGYYIYHTDWFRAKRRGFTWPWGDAFINFWPNPGFQIGNFHRCRAHGKHVPLRPHKLGLKPGKRFSEGTPEYARRMEFLRRGE